MLPPPDKHELELEVDGYFRNGDKKDVARLLQKDSSTISRQLSPNQEHNNNLVYFFILALWAFDCIRRELGDAVINLVLRERAKWLGDALPFVPCPAKLTANIGREFSEYLEAELLDKSFDEQIKECVDIAVAVEQKKVALIARRNAKHFGIQPNGNGILPPHIKAAAGRKKG